MQDSHADRFRLAACCVLACTVPLFGTSIQLSPLVGWQSRGLYRSPSYNRTVDQYGRQVEEDYTVKISSMRVQLSAGLEGQYDDNVALANSGKEEDGVSLTPMVYSRINWPLNPGFQIHSGLSLGYKWYAAGGSSANDGGLIIGGADGAMNSQIGCDLRLGQNGLLSASEEYYRDVGAFESGDRQGRQYTTNRNLLNLQYRNDFTEFTSGTAKVTHTNQWVDRSEYSAQNYASDFLDVAVMTYLNRQFQAGPYGRVGMFNYTEKKHNDSDEVEGGLAMVYGTTERLVLSGSVGVSNVSFDTTNNAQATDAYTGLTTQWAIRYSSNQITSHRLMTSYGAQQGNLDADVNFTKEWLTQYTIAVTLREDLWLTGDLGYIDSSESDGGESYNIYRAGIGLEYQVVRDTTVGLRYLRDWRTSDNRSDADYTRNVVALRVVYRL